MCTLSWLLADGGYELRFNRDERRTRGPETPAAACEQGGVRYLAPGDGEAGGTWLLVNEHGLTVCLLNAYAPETADAATRRSRGLLVRELAPSASPGEALDRARAGDLRRYEPFFVALFDPTEGVRVAGWDGRDLREVREPAPPLVSSGVAQERVRAHRRAAWAELTGGAPTAADLEAFHGSHAGGPSELSPCMHRADAETRSSCRVRVTGAEVELVHVPGSPCRTRPLPALRLARRAPAAAR